jgi:GNAT superfamily N-acetyltransferase
LGAIAALTVAETTGDAAIHRRYGLKFPAGAGVARYASLAVLPAYRRTNVFVRLVEEARKLFVSRRNIRYTWFDPGAERASRPRLASVAGYRRAGIAAPNRSCRVLLCDEWSAGCANGILNGNPTSLRGVERVCRQAG